MRYIRETGHQGLLWVNVTRQNERELKEVQKRFGLLPADIKESLPPFQRPKIVKRADYYFMVLHFPVFDRETRRLGFTEVDFFLNANFLITVHDDKLLPIDEFFSECSKDANTRIKFFQGTMVGVLFELMQRLLEAIFPILLHVNDDINVVDKKLFAKMPGKEMAEEILRLKSNIVTFRRTMQGHKTVLDRLVLYAGRELNLASYQNYISSLREFTMEIWHMLESQKESINALHETNESILTLRTNEIMKTLTIISVITFPLTLVATLFAVHAQGTPFLEHSFGFWILFGLTILGALFMLVIFKKRRWI
ncbi:MAG TPA: magnesium transporter CorA family protein [Patescibacteria group bacterium]|nr:magnesium transporter CorA family protein [Patescibacteria group bacterium]